MRTALRSTVIGAAVLGVAAVVVLSQDNSLAGVLLSTAGIGKQASGYYLVATNQLLRPWTEQWALKGRPVEIAFDQAKELLAVLNSNGVHLMDASAGTELARIPSKSTSYTGLAFRPGVREVWASEATRNGPDGILVAQMDEKGLPGEVVRIALPGHPVPAGIAFSPDGSTAWVAFTNNNSVAIVDARTRLLKREMPAGMVPYSVAISAKRKLVFVSNRGGRRPQAKDSIAWSSSSNVVTNPETGATATGLVSVFTLEGEPIREITVGLAPAGVALSPDEATLVVANAHSDSVTLVDLESYGTSEVKIPAYPIGSFGSTPTSAVFSADGRRIYVTCGGTNAIAVLEREAKATQWALSGAIPTGWYPTAIALDANGALRVVNVKGTGNTSNDRGTFNSRQFEGSVWRIPEPEDVQIKAGLREVVSANSPQFTAAGGVSDLSKLGIEHVFLIIKENRTYDQVFADLPKGNRDPKLLMYGREVTPNHHALAEQFVLLDNFYTGGAISFDGHQWLMQGFVSDYVERAMAASPRGYAWNMADALTVSPAGFFWQDPRRAVDVRLYGALSLPVKWDPKTQRAVDINETDLLPWGDYWRLYQEGNWRDAVGCRAGVPALQKHMSVRYPVSSMNITDQIRAEAWLEDLAEREKTGKMPNLLIFTMTSDHTMGKRPGFPTPRAMVADNDLALGRIVESISKSRFWPKSLILVTEDDAQDGVDHVDGRRTICLAIGPMIRRGIVDSNHYNHSSVIRTIQDVFRIQPRVRYAASARPMRTLFTTSPDLTPYKLLKPEVSLTEMNPPLAALKGRELWAAQQSLRIKANEVDEFPADIMNRILWGDAKGYNAPYPGVVRTAPR